MDEERLDEIKREIALKKEEQSHTYLPTNTEPQQEKDTVAGFKNQTLKQIQDDFKTGKLNADDGMKQIVNVLTIVDATSDPKLRNDLKKDASKSLKSYMRSITYKDEENKIEHRHKRNEAFYKAFRPVLEFDLSHLIGKKKKRIVERDKVTGKKIVKYEDITEEPKKTYSDRSYGLVLMFVMIGLFIVPYCVANIVLAVGRAINAMFECFAQFGRTAFYLCTSIAGMAIVGVVIYVILLIVQSAFGVQIFK